MGRGKRRDREGGVSLFPGMRSDAGTVAVQDLLHRLWRDAEPDLDLDELKREADDGLALIASLHPEAASEAVHQAVYAQIRQWLPLLGIGLSGPDEPF